MPTTPDRRIGPPPTTELGAPGVFSWAGWLDTWEETAELVFPMSLKVFDRMRRSDSQIDAVLKAADLPILATRWKLDGDGCDPRVVKALAAELGLDLEGKALRNQAARRRRRGEGVVFRDVLRHALLSRPFGFMPLEQVYAAGPPAPGQEDTGLPALMYHIRKLAPRMPRTITGIDVAGDGGLIGIRQYVSSPTASPANPGTTREVVIPAERLVMFVHDREGGDWTGRSILRSSYGHWLIKVALLKLGPMVAERNGMGVPVVYYSADASREEALEFAKGFRSGEEAGAALPDGKMRAELLGVTGTLKDELPLLKYHDEAIGRSALAMFLNLGHDNGARSLGETFVDYFLAAEMATVTDLEDTLTEHVARDWVEANYGPDEPYPRIEAEELAADSAPTAEGIAALLNSGALTADPGLEDELRRRFRLPAIDDADRRPRPAAPGPAGDPASQDGAPLDQLPAGTETPAGVSPDELLKMVNAAAALIRSGFAPDAALIAVGLDPIQHLGLLPVTVQKPEQPVAGLGTPTPADVARAFLAADTRPALSIAERAAAVAERAARLAASHA